MLCGICDWNGDGEYFVCFSRGILRFFLRVDVKYELYCI